MKAIERILDEAVAEGRIDTVLVCLVDMQGRLMGKRFVARHFVDEAWQETIAAITFWPPIWRWRRRMDMPRRAGNRAMATM